MGCLPLRNMAQLAAHAAEEEADIQHLPDARMMASIKNMGMN